MPVTLASNALITELEYKEQGSGIDASDPTQDDAIRFAINSASARIMDYSDCEFKDSGAGATRIFPITRGGCYWNDVSFGSSDARTITTVVIDTQMGQTGLTLTTSQYQPVPVTITTGGVYTGLHILTGATGYVVPGARRQATVTGTWGWPSVPAEVKHACVETVKDWLAAEYQVQSGDAAATFNFNSLALPARVRATLDQISSKVLLA